MTSDRVLRWSGAVLGRCAPPMWLEQQLTRSDALMYETKSGGRDRVRLEGWDAGAET